MEVNLKKHGLEWILFFILAVVASFLVYDKMIIFTVILLFAAVVFVLAGGYKIPVEDRSIMWKLALGALLLRILFIIATLVFNNPFLQADGITYGRIGDVIAQTWSSGDHYVIRKANYGYYYFNGFIYYITGYYPEVVRLINSFFAIGAALNLYFISLHLSGRKAAKFTFVLTAYFPSFIVWSALNLKEGLCVFLISYVVKHVLEMMRDFRISKLAAVCLALFFLVTLRFYVAILLGVIIAISFTFLAANFRLNKRMLYGLLVVILIGVVLFQSGYGFLGRDYLASQSLKTIEEQHNAGAIGDSAFSEEVDFSSYTMALKYLPVGLLYFIFGPLPWQDGGLLKIISLPEMLVLYILYLFVLPGIISLWRHRRGECLFLLFLLSGFTIIYAMGGSNMGGIYRVRFQVLSLLFLLISHGMVGQKQYKSSKLIRDRVGMESE